jgi:hypothetical protein
MSRSGITIRTYPTYRARAVAVFVRLCTKRAADADDLSLPRAAVCLALAAKFVHLGQR